MKRRKVSLQRNIQQIKKHLDNLAELDFKARFEYLRLRVPRSLRRWKLWASNKYHELRHPLPEDLKRVRKANEKATKYLPLPPKFGGRLVLFRASNQPFGHVPDPFLGWSEIAQHRMEAIEVEGNHDTLLWEPKVGKVATIFKQVLTEVRANYLNI